MKAIAISTEPKALEPGLGARAVRPVTGFGFEHLFTLIDAVVPPEALGVDAGQPAVELSADAPFAGLTPIMAPPGQIDAGALPLALPALGRQAGDAILHPTEWMADADLPSGLTPLAAPQTEAQGPTPGDVELAVPPDWAMAAAGLILPPAAQILPGTGSPGAPEGATEILPAAQGPESPALVGGVDIAVVGAVAPSVETLAVPFAPPEVFDTLAKAEDAAVRSPDKAPQAQDAAQTPQPVSGKLGPVLADINAKPLPVDGAGRPLDRAVVPGDPSPRPAVDPARLAEDLGPDASTQTLPRTPQDARADRPVGTPILKPMPLAGAALPDLGEAPQTPVAATPVTPAAPAAPAIMPPNPAMPAATLQGAMPAARNGQGVAKAATDAAPAAAAMADAIRSEAATGPTERAEPLSGLTAGARAPNLAPPPPLPMPVALPSGAVLNLRHADWGKQLVSQIERMVSNGSQRIELSLRPKNLGEIQVTLDLSGDRTVVHIITETAAAARLLNGTEDRLAQVLDQSGYRLSGFSAQEQGPGSQGGQQGQQGQQGQPSPRRSRPTAETGKREEASEAAATSPYSVDRSRSAGINMLA